MLPRDLRIVIGVACAVLASACNSCLGLPSPVDRSDSLPKSCAEIPAQPPAELVDILFVIDNSNSMAEEQAEVASNLEGFISAIRVLGGIPQKLRVGVVTTSVYQNVRGLPYWDCDPTTGGEDHYCDQSGGLQLVSGFPDQRFIDSDTDPMFLEKLQGLVKQGTSGSGQETPFEALRLAFKDPRNKSFLRDGARLLIVVLSDEDDCSETARPPRVIFDQERGRDYCHEQGTVLTPVSQYHDIIASLRDSKGNPKDITYAAIAPVAISDKTAAAISETLPDGTIQVRNVDCPTSAEPGFRHREMAALFRADRKNLDSICKSSYRQTLIDIAGLLDVSQFLPLQGVTDPALLKVRITRADGSFTDCTVGDGLKFTEAAQQSDGTFSSAQLEFVDRCLRRRDDTQLNVDRVCVF